MKTTLFALAGLLAVGASALAQERSNSAQYHAVHNPNSPYYAGSNQQPAAPQPTGYWEKTWGAIAPSPVGGVLGTAVGASSKEEAERIALADCKAKGGGACKVDVAYHNQCAAMVLGERTYSWARAASEAEAAEIGMGDCKKGNENCRVYYSACTEPIFHKY